MFYQGFPQELREEVAIVSKIVLTSKCLAFSTMGDSCEVSDGAFSHFTLCSGEQISIPYRVYLADESNTYQFTFVQKMIYHAIYTRHFDGRIREKHLIAIMSENYPQWSIPYIFKLTDEYVIDILDMFEKYVPRERLDEFRSFIKVNPEEFQRSYFRMVSYWNEYHRKKHYVFKEYVGARIYSDFLGYVCEYPKAIKHSNHF